MSAPRKFTYAPPLRGLVKKRNPATVPVDASSDALNLTYEAGQFGTRRGYEIRRRIEKINEVPGYYGSLVRITDGAIFPFICHNGSVYLDVGIEYGGEEIANGFVKSRYPSVVHLPTAVIFNGVNRSSPAVGGLPVLSSTRPVVWDGSTAFDAGMDAPGAATSGSALSAAGAFSGKVNVLVTFGSSTWNVESGPGAAEAIGFASSGQSLTVNNIPVSTDPRCDYRNVWVSDHTGEFYMLAKRINDNTTATTGLMGDWESRSTTLARKGGFYATAVVPNGDVCAYHEGRYFVADGGTLKWSLLGAPEVFHPLAQAGFNDPRGITCLFSHGGSLYVAGRSNIWRLTGSFDMAEDGTPDYSAMHLSEGVGVVGRSAMAGAGTVVFFLADQGFMRQQGDESPAPLSDDKIEPLIDDINDLWASEAVLLYARQTGEVLAAVPMRNSQGPRQNQRVITMRVRGEHFSINHLRLSSISKAYDDGQEEELFAMDYSGNVLRLNYSHGDGLQGDEAYADGAATVWNGIKITTIGAAASSGQTVLTLDSDSLPGDDELRGIQMACFDLDKESATYGDWEIHKVLLNDQSAKTVTVEDPVGTGMTHAFLGSPVAVHETPKQDAGTPGNQKLVQYLEIGIGEVEDA